MAFEHRQPEAMIGVGVARKKTDGFHPEKKIKNEDNREINDILMLLGDDFESKSCDTTTSSHGKRPVIKETPDNQCVKPNSGGSESTSRDADANSAEPCESPKPCAVKKCGGSVQTITELWGKSVKGKNDSVTARPRTVEPQNSNTGCQPAKCPARGFALPANPHFSSKHSGQPPSKPVVSGIMFNTTGNCSASNLGEIRPDIAGIADSVVNVSGGACRHGREDVTTAVVPLKKKRRTTKASGTARHCARTSTARKDAQPSGGSVNPAQYLANITGDGSIGDVMIISKHHSESQTTRREQRDVLPSSSQESLQHEQQWAFVNPQPDTTAEGPKKTDESTLTQDGVNPLKDRISCTGSKQGVDPRWFDIAGGTDYFRNAIVYYQTIAERADTSQSTRSTTQGPANRRHAEVASLVGSRTEENTDVCEVWPAHIAFYLFEPCGDERPCERGIRCVARMTIPHPLAGMDQPIIGRGVSGIKNTRPARLGVILKEFLTPDERRQFDLHGILPPKRGPCILCIRGRCTYDDIVSCLGRAPLCSPAHRNPVGIPGGYTRESCIQPRREIANGIVAPIRRLVSDEYVCTTLDAAVERGVVILTPTEVERLSTAASTRKRGIGGIPACHGYAEVSSVYFFWQTRWLSGQATAGGCESPFVSVVTYKESTTAHPPGSTTYTACDDCTEQDCRVAKKKRVRTEWAWDQLGSTVTMSSGWSTSHTTKVENKLRIKGKTQEDITATAAIDTSDGCVFGPGGIDDENGIGKVERTVVTPDDDALSMALGCKHSPFSTMTTEFACRLGIAVPLARMLAGPFARACRVIKNAFSGRSRTEEQELDAKAQDASLGRAVEQCAEWASHVHSALADAESESETDASISDALHHVITFTCGECTVYELANSLLVLSEKKSKDRISTVCNHRKWSEVTKSEPSKNNQKVETDMLTKALGACVVVLARKLRENTLESVRDIVLGMRRWDSEQLPQPPGEHSVYICAMLRDEASSDVRLSIANDALVVAERKTRKKLVALGVVEHTRDMTTEQVVETATKTGRGFWGFPRKTTRQMELSDREMVVSTTIDIGGPQRASGKGLHLCKAKTATRHRAVSQSTLDAAISTQAEYDAAHRPLCVMLKRMSASGVCIDDRTLLDTVDGKSLYSTCDFGSFNPDRHATKAFVPRRPQRYRLPEMVDDQLLADVSRAYITGVAAKRTRKHLSATDKAVVASFGATAHGFPIPAQHIVPDVVVARMAFKSHRTIVMEAVRSGVFGPGITSDSDALVVISRGRAPACGMTIADVLSEFWVAASRVRKLGRSATALAAVAAGIDKNMMRLFAACGAANGTPRSTWFDRSLTLCALVRVALAEFLSGIIREKQSKNTGISQQQAVPGCNTVDECQQKKAKSEQTSETGDVCVSVESLLLRLSLFSWTHADLISASIGVDTETSTGTTPSGQKTKRVRMTTSASEHGPVTDSVLKMTTGKDTKTNSTCVAERLYPYDWRATSDEDSCKITSELAGCGFFDESSDQTTNSTTEHIVKKVVPRACVKRHTTKFIARTVEQCPQFSMWLVDAFDTFTRGAYAHAMARPSFAESLLDVRPVVTELSTEMTHHVAAFKVRQHAREYSSAMSVCADVFRGVAAGDQVNVCRGIAMALRVAGDIVMVLAGDAQREIITAAADIADSCADTAVHSAMKLFNPETECGVSPDTMASGRGLCDKRPEVVKAAADAFARAIVAETYKKHTEIDEWDVVDGIVTQEDRDAMAKRVLETISETLVNIKNVTSAVTLACERSRPSAVTSTTASQNTPMVSKSEDGVTGASKDDNDNPKVRNGKKPRAQKRKTRRPTKHAAIVIAEVEARAMHAASAGVDVGVVCNAIACGFAAAGARAPPMEIIAGIVGSNDMKSFICGAADVALREMSEIAGDVCDSILFATSRGDTLLVETMVECVCTFLKSRSGCEGVNYEELKTAKSTDKTISASVTNTIVFAADVAVRELTALRDMDQASVARLMNAHMRKAKECDAPEQTAKVVMAGWTSIKAVLKRAVNTMRVSSVYKAKRDETERTRENAEKLTRELATTGTNGSEFVRKHATLCHAAVCERVVAAMSRCPALMAAFSAHADWFPEFVDNAMHTADALRKRSSELGRQLTENEAIDIADSESDKLWRGSVYHLRKCDLPSRVVRIASACADKLISRGVRFSRSAMVTEDKAALIRAYVFARQRARHDDQRDDRAIDVESLSLFGMRDHGLNVVNTLHDAQSRLAGAKEFKSIVKLFTPDEFMLANEYFVALSSAMAIECHPIRSREWIEASVTAARTKYGLADDEFSDALCRVVVCDTCDTVLTQLFSSVEPVVSKVTSCNSVISGPDGSLRCYRDRVAPRGHCQSQRKSATVSSENCCRNCEQCGSSGTSKRTTLVAQNGHSWEHNIIERACGGQCECHRRTESTEDNMTPVEAEIERSSLSCNARVRRIFAVGKTVGIQKYSACTAGSRTAGAAGESGYDSMAPCVITPCCGAWSRFVYSLWGADGYRCVMCSLRRGTGCVLPDVCGCCGSSSVRSIITDRNGNERPTKTYTATSGRDNTGAPRKRSELVTFIKRIATMRLSPASITGIVGADGPSLPVSREFQNAIIVVDDDVTGLVIPLGVCKRCFDVSHEIRKVEDGPVFLSFLRASVVKKFREKTAAANERRRDRTKKPPREPRKRKT